MRLKYPRHRTAGLPSGGGEDGRESALARHRLLTDAEAMDMLAAKLNEPGDCNGGDFVELGVQLVLQTGREIADELEEI